MRNIFLTGFKGSGKSTLGKMAATSMDRKFYDLDTLIEDQYEAEKGAHLGCRDIFRVEGEVFFRALERQTAFQLERSLVPAENNLLVALGGGAIMDDEIRLCLKRMGIIVCLVVPFSELMERIRRNGTPAFTTPEKMEVDMRTLYEQRDPVCRSQADLLVETGGLEREVSAAKLKAAIEKALARRPD